MPSMPTHPAISRQSRRGLLCVCLLLAPVFSGAATVVFTGAEGEPGTSFRYLDPAMWSGGVLPAAGDDVVTHANFIHDGPAETIRIKSLRLEEKARGHFMRASLAVAEGIVVASTLETQRPSSMVSWGDSLVVESGTEDAMNTISIVDGLAQGSDGKPAPRLSGHSLTMKASTRLRLRWFTDTPRGLPGNTVPLIRLTGEASFEPGVVLRLQFEQLSPGGGLLAGEYLLMTAPIFKGQVPRLELLGLPDATRPGAELRVTQVSPKEKRLVLVVSPARK
jgi:hypothetical protein